ncbi:pseudouridine synthase [Streptococcus dysgalactiae]|uniref:Pseudouridine synthase n=1 Tax=Streptococcus dysgalactiae TaxID=1334 RepID=A0AAF0A072_STRDY|nr:pseudouridine synthase [Streptococcus dysgalactiae]QGH04721.1 rRNA pseudouridine synthase [Streptococcus dysgalactiae subsp. dysgalactiae]WAI93815.1 rRNA pseudouridine synthase [Streptococcus dysgalactiae]WCE86631.1 pseudouridine synthase [Streptococcus dysgalactiae]WCN26626.1 pseudouridine synthase [Streptococcus dysgalactiae]BBE39982.1 ribosomal small subunit pseudouridine synthase A [Streptococcus dysgalactiae]
MRLDKFLVETGVGSRSQVKSLLKKKAILVNQEVETSPKVQINEHKDVVTYLGKPLTYEAFVYYVLNKPAGFLSATKDRAQATVIDLLDETARQKDVFPVGRLDKDTRGLLLLTNNGQLAHDLLSPKKHVTKEYLAKVAGIMTDADKDDFAKGISLKDHQCLPAKLEVLDKDLSQETCVISITIQEGKFHQVKRMVAACGKEVLELQRLSMGPLRLDPSLAEGDFRRLTSDELQSLEPYCQNLL